jgi:hypothetical protein
VYADHLVSVTAGPAGVLITLGVGRFTPEAANEQPVAGKNAHIYVTARLALSPRATTELINALNSIRAASQKSEGTPH